VLKWNSVHFEEASPRWEDSLAPALYSSVMGAQATVESDGYVYFTSSYPLYRCRATAASIIDLPSSYEGWTCLENGTTAADGKVVRDGTGNLLWTWRPQTPALSEADEKSLRQRGIFNASEGWVSLIDAATGKSVGLRRGSTHWNAHLGRYLILSSAAAGEIYMSVSETSSIVGPYHVGTLVAAHNSTGSGLDSLGSDTGLATNCYNPTQHPFLSSTVESPGDEIIYFSCTFTTSFAPEYVDCGALLAQLRYF